MALQKDYKIWAVTGIIILAVVIIALLSFRSSDRDDLRVEHLKEIQTALRMYYFKFQIYPRTLPELLGAGVGIRAIPDDPLAPKQNYKYAVGDEERQYILLAVFEDWADYRLRSDIDGKHFGINCDDRPIFNYCVGNF